MKLVSGNSNRPLAEAIAAYLNLPLTKCSVRRFADMEVFVEIQENVRGEDVFVVQSTSFPTNDHLMELLIITDALRRASAKRVTAVVPYFGYARQDRKPGPRTPISAKLVANMIERAGADRVLTIEDTKELSVSCLDSLSWVTSPEVDMQLMLRRALRATPKRIVIGEVRGGEAYQLLKMWGTGHSGGLCTIHSDKGALDGLRRLERMCGESEEARGMGRDWIRETVADVVHVLVNITKVDGVRKIPRIVKVSGFDTHNNEYAYESIER